jgi:hypothetical protein
LTTTRSEGDLGTRQLAPDDFPKYATRQSLARFLARYELFKLQLEVKGSIVECGVHQGAGLLAWAKLSAALEPYSLHRHVVGFDTFAGFPAIHAKDRGTQRENRDLRPGGLDGGGQIYEELTELIREYDENRFLSQYQKVYLVKGDAVQTIPAFIASNPHLLVSLLFLDFDLYEPTKVALDSFLPRMGKGAVVAFDEINSARWPGETQALLEAMDLRSYRIQQFPMDPNIAYIVL